MKQKNFPPGWDEERVRRVLAEVPLSKRPLGSSAFSPPRAPPPDGELGVCYDTRVRVTKV
ncbi:MAG: hypothetical protein HY725_02995 [Candidatus Rokubacteria bacterium]|nr:hypothetical protein [Candidatus Rokubacteria bacterium]